MARKVADQPHDVKKKVPDTFSFSSSPILLSKNASGKVRWIRQSGEPRPVGTDPFRASTLMPAPFTVLLE
jgi:hypothetical protein